MNHLELLLWYISWGRHKVILYTYLHLSTQQVKSYESWGISAAFVGQHQVDPKIKEGVLQGLYSLVHISPESMLTSVIGRCSVLMCINTI